MTRPCYVCLLAAALVSAAFAQVHLPAGAVHTLLEGDSAPAWLGLPHHGQVQLPFGVKLEMVHSLVLSRNGPREAVLVGAFRNRGDEVRGVRLTLHYLNREFASAGPVTENLAAVSVVATDELLPFRFALVSREALTGPAAFYRLVVETEAAERFRPLPGIDVRLIETKVLDRRRGASIKGVVHVTSPPPDPATIAVTVMLFDGREQVLDVVTEHPFAGRTVPHQGPWPFEIRTAMPVPQPVKHVKVWTTVLR